MGETLVIVNPASAGGATGRAWPGIASDLATHYGRFKVAITTQAGEAVRLAEAAARDGVKLIVACGGDGTVNEVANGILNSGVDAEFGIIPSGTGGDFRRTLAISVRPAAAAAVLRDGQTIRMDVGRAHFTHRDGETRSRYFLGMASFGLSGEVIARAKRERSAWMPSLPGAVDSKLAYAAAAFQAVLAHGSVEALVAINGNRERRLRFANLCIANARYFGGGMKMAPDARITDGQLDVVLVGDLSAGRILANAPRLYMGKHLTMDHVHHQLATVVEARPLPDGPLIAVELDGELPGHLPSKFEIIPRALRVRVPA